MKKIKIILTAFIATLLATSCTQYHFEDTGLANGKHEKSMWDYFGEDAYNWDSLRVMARRANLVSLFQGNSAYGKDFTFFGPTNITIMRYLQDNHLNSIADIPVNDCKTFILNGVLRKHMMLDDFKHLSEKEAKCLRWLLDYNYGFTAFVKPTTMFQEQGLCKFIWCRPPLHERHMSVHVTSKRKQAWYTL